EQFRKADDPAFELDLARRFVSGKLHNCRVLLRRQLRRNPSRQLERAIHRLRSSSNRLPQAATLDEVRGLEGAGAAAYFEMLGQHLVPEPFRFNQRTRRPPRDPFNALLSFGYAMLLGTVSTAVQVVGLDPYLGSLHSADVGKPSLVLDLMEEFRPLLVDAVALRVVRRRQFSLDDFQLQPEVALPEGLEEDEAPALEDYPVLLSRDGRRKWITAYETTLREACLYPRFGTQLTHRQICLEQARLLARHVKGEEAYEAFTVR
ncbi:MAG: CRISPR-associated endonuclease Cas1, partial [Candidatus Eremiobacterota bacterium]